MNKIIIFILFTFFTCTQEKERIKIDYLKNDKDFRITFMKNDYLIDLDTVNVIMEVSKKILLQNNKVSNSPKNIAFSNDTLFGQNSNRGLGYAVFTYHKNKRIKIRDFTFKKNTKYELELVIQYRNLISLAHKKKIINNHLVKKDSVKKKSEYQSYLLKNTKESHIIINSIIPDSLKGYLLFNIVDKKKKHQFYQYEKIRF